MRIYRFLEKITIKKVHFSQFLKGPLQFIKITLHSIGYMGMNCLVIKHYFHGIYAFSKKKVNFTRSCAFAQKVKFYALQMLKKTKSHAS